MFKCRMPTLKKRLVYIASTIVTKFFHLWPCLIHPVKEQDEEVVDYASEYKKAPRIDPCKIRSLWPKEG